MALKRKRGNEETRKRVFTYFRELERQTIALASSREKVRVEEIVH